MNNNLTSGNQNENCNIPTRSTSIEIFTPDHASNVQYSIPPTIPMDSNRSRIGHQGDSGLPMNSIVPIHQPHNPDAVPMSLTSKIQATIPLTATLVMSKTRGECTGPSPLVHPETAIQPALSIHEQILLEGYKQHQQQQPPRQSSAISDKLIWDLNPKSVRKVPQYENPTPSRYCHICGRIPKEELRVVCSEIHVGTCRKITCKRCFLAYSSGNFEDARKLEKSKWLCTHCIGNCPGRAQCKTYQKINDKMRLNRLKLEPPIHRMRKQGTTGSSVPKDISLGGIIDYILNTQGIPQQVLESAILTKVKMNYGSTLQPDPVPITTVGAASTDLEPTHLNNININERCNEMNIGIAKHVPDFHETGTENDGDIGGITHSDFECFTSRYINENSHDDGNEHGEWNAMVSKNTRDKRKVSRIGFDSEVCDFPDFADYDYDCMVDDGLHEVLNRDVDSENYELILKRDENGNRKAILTGQRGKSGQGITPRKENACMETEEENIGKENDTETEKGKAEYRKENGKGNIKNIRNENEKMKFQESEKDKEAGKLIEAEDSNVNVNISYRGNEKEDVNRSGSKTFINLDKNRKHYKTISGLSRNEIVKHNDGCKLKWKRNGNGTFSPCSSAHVAAVESEFGTSSSGKSHIVLEPGTTVLQGKCISRENHFEDNIEDLDESLGMRYSESLHSSAATKRYNSVELSSSSINSPKNHQPIPLLSNTDALCSTLHQHIPKMMGRPLNNCMSPDGTYPNKHCDTEMNFNEMNISPLDNTSNWNGDENGMTVGNCSFERNSVLEDLNDEFRRQRSIHSDYFDFGTYYKKEDDSNSFHNFFFDVDRDGEQAVGQFDWF